MSCPESRPWARDQEDKTDFLPLGVFVAKQRQELQEPDVEQDVLNVHSTPETPPRTSNPWNTP